MRRDGPSVHDDEGEDDDGGGFTDDDQYRLAPQRLARQVSRSHLSALYSRSERHLVGRALPTSAAAETALRPAEGAGSEGPATLRRSLSYEALSKAAGMRSTTPPGRPGRERGRDDDKRRETNAGGDGDGDRDGDGDGSDRRARQSSQRQRPSSPSHRASRRLESPSLLSPLSFYHLLAAEGSDRGHGSVGRHGLSALATPVSPVPDAAAASAESARIRDNAIRRQVAMRMR